jgi:nuclear GTP-binding protein
MLGEYGVDDYYYWMFVCLLVLRRSSLLTKMTCPIVPFSLYSKSSVINTLISKKSCRVAPIPGETKIWQYISLFKRISLIDCPGVVVDTAGDTEEDSVLKGVVRAERLENPEDFIDAIQAKVKREHIAAQYNLPKDGDDTWTSIGELMEMIAKKSGRLLKGGDPDIRSAAITLINDFQRGRLPHYVPPPELKEDEKETESKADKDLKQDLDAIGEEHMEKGTEQDDIDDEDSKPKATEKKTEQAPEVEDGPSDSEEEEPMTASTSLIGSGDWED